MLDSALIDKLVRTYCEPELCGKLSNVLSKATYIKSLINNVKHEIELEEIRHNNIIAKLVDNINKIRDDCDHQSRTYHYDPSGGNDSYYECDICGYCF